MEIFSERITLAVRMDGNFFETDDELLVHETLRVRFRVRGHKLFSSNLKKFCKGSKKMKKRKKPFHGTQLLLKDSLNLKV